MEQEKTVRKTGTVIRWIVFAVFVGAALVYLPHYSCILFLLAAFLMMPLEVVKTLLLKIKLKQVVAIVLSAVLFCTGALLAPIEETPSGEDSFTSEFTTSAEPESTLPLHETTVGGVVSDITTEPDAVTTEWITETVAVTTERVTEPETTKAHTEVVTMVWISSTGSKYHSKSNCSGMTSARQISLEEAVNQGYTPCKNCH